MANIIDASIFVGEIEIPNSNQEEIAVDLLNSITIYEKEVLINLLGYTLYKELKSVTPVAGDKWYKLINGDEYSFVYNGRTVSTEWQGLKNLIAYYVYFEHRRKRASYHSGVGTEVEAATENTKEASLYTKLVEVWNKFVDMYGGWYVEDGTIQPYYHDSGLPSAYSYLVAKKTDFPNWFFTSQGEYINRFGITEW